ncbi:unnamed protein product [Schistosoma mattheei]|uniref:Uncharacterized protein n=1 Tax=Schistosoma mattheei TaxID=31246 RepID=A0AA85BW51_9TREM|nr:unnamed protein product [Schistosoma mattheei]
MNQIRWLSVLHSKEYFILILSFITFIPSFVSVNEIHDLNRQTNDYPSIEKIFSKVKEAEQINLLNNEKIKVEPDQLIVAPMRFSRLRRYFRHQKRMMRAQLRMMRLQRRLYRRHYRPRYGYGYFP